MNFLAKSVSYILHPVLAPSYTMSLLLSLNSIISYQIPFKSKIYLVAMVFVATAILPVYMIFSLKRKGYVKSYYMETQEERTYPIFLSALIYAVPFFMFRNLNIDITYKVFFAGSVIMLLITMGINYMMKISLHLVAMGAMTGTIIGVSIVNQIHSVPLVILLVLLSGITGYARLKTASHKPFEIYVGFLTGFLIMIPVFLFFT